MTQLRIRVTGRNLDVGDAMRQKVTEDLHSHIGKYSSSRNGEAIVTLAKEKSNYIVEILLHLDSKISLETKADAHEVHAAFADALDKMEKRLRREKGKATDHHNGEVLKGVEIE